MNDTVIACDAATVPAEITRLEAVIRDLEAKNAALVKETLRLGRLVQDAQARGDRYKHDVDRRLKDISDLRAVIAREQTRADQLSVSLVEARKQINARAYAGA